MILAALDRRRFDALAGYARSPEITLITEELAGYATPDERVLGLVLRDRIDNDFSFVVFGQDEVLRYRAIDAGSDYPSIDDAFQALYGAMLAARTRANFNQGDTAGEPVDFFAPAISTNRQHNSFQQLANQPKFSPAKELIAAMMRYHEDLDGRWVQNFQAAGFDARLWELYLWATFTELGFVRSSKAQVPDLILRSLRGELAVEAATANPPDGQIPRISDFEDPADFLENYIPIRLAQALKGKLKRTPRYWEEPDVAGLPFCIAVQDFSVHSAMRFITPAATEYTFGVRHSIVDGIRKIERIKSHRFGKKITRSGFFSEPGAENVSAVIVNPSGTLIKFNRLGYAAGFGRRDIRMVRTGILRREGKADGPAPIPFKQVVDHSYDETWVEGMVVLHNRNAKVPLDPALIPGAAHEFLQADGRIMTLLPEFHPFTSETWIGLSEDQDDSRSA